MILYLTVEWMRRNVGKVEHYIRKFNITPTEKKNETNNYIKIVSVN